jgi:hypothetical protein
MTYSRRLLLGLTSGMLGVGAYTLAGWTGWGIFMVATTYGLVVAATS